MKKEVADSMSLQDFVDFCVKKTAEQGVQCRRKNERTDATPCAYGNDKGQHCIVGWGCDKDQVELMEFIGGVEGLCSSYEDLVPQHLKDNLDLFFALQDIHDVNDSEAARLALIRKIQTRFGISTSGEHWKLLAKLRNL